MSMVVWVWSVVAMLEKWVYLGGVVDCIVNV
jgi:hypothetical protein